MNKFSEVMKKHSDEMLIDIYNNHREDYVPEAVEAMIEELKTRGLENCTATQQEILPLEKESDYDIAIRKIMQLERKAVQNK